MDVSKCVTEISIIQIWKFLDAILEVIGKVKYQNTFNKDRMMKKRTNLALIEKIQPRCFIII